MVTAHALSFSGRSDSWVWVYFVQHLGHVGIVGHFPNSLQNCKALTIQGQNMGFAHVRKTPKQICDSHFSEKLLKQNGIRTLPKKTHKQYGIRTFPKKLLKKYKTRSSSSSSSSSISSSSC